MSAPEPEPRPMHSRVKHDVAARCKAKGWTLEEFAARAGIDRVTLYHVTQRSRVPTDITLRGIAKQLGMKVGERVDLLVPTRAQLQAQLDEVTQ